MKLLTLSIALSASTAGAMQSQASKLNSETSETEIVVVTGSRFGSRTAVDSPSPIDFISKEELTSGGQTELQDMLRIDVPSFNIARPVTSGVADFLRSPTLRGLSPGQTLLLVNGKRRHTNSDLNVGNQIGRGDVAYNFNAIPINALKRIEVLRDGASAQYGSDAVAGIINIILDDSLGGNASFNIGQTSEGDGEKATMNAGYGWAIGDDGFVRVSTQFQTQDFSNRSRLDTRQQFFGTDDDGNPTSISNNFGSGTGLTPSNGQLDPRETTIDRNTFIFGQPKYDNLSVFINSGYVLTEEVELFAFGGYSELSGTNPNFFRRAGQDQTVREIHPDGFIPFQEIDLIDYSFAIGLRGDDFVGFGWEVSSLYGKSKTNLAFSNSNNVSFGTDSPTDFKRGGTRLSQWTTNVDLTRLIDIESDSPLKVAFGAEYRKEYFEAIAGDLLSYQFGGVPIIDGPNAGNVAPAGSQPVPGTSPDEEVDEDRDSVAIYAEVEKEWNDIFLVSLAGRFEDYSDFGSTTDFRLSSRLALSDEINVRASVGSAYRAPALPQQHFQRSEISFAAGVPTATRIVSPNDELASFIGANPLSPEEATTMSFGATYNVDRFSASVDVYEIDLNDRIVLSSQFTSPALTQLLQDNGFGEIRAVTFETNAIDTTTQGIDITLGYRNQLLKGNLTSTLAAGFVDTEFDRISGTPEALKALGITRELFDLRSQTRLAEGTPNSKITFNLNWQRDQWTVDLTTTRYGEVSQADLSNLSQEQVDVLIDGFDTTVIPSTNGNFDIIETFGEKIVTDLSISYQINEAIRLKVGADNLFDVYPDEQVATTIKNTLAGTRGSDNRGIFPYSYLSPFGVSGRYIYTSVGFSF
tara:strand:- start:1368 stop:3959 length:2592 start_codon:yes stop_codon:yes gene_type:complete